MKLYLTACMATEKDLVVNQMAGIPSMLVNSPHYAEKNLKSNAWDKLHLDHDDHAWN